MFSLFRLLTKVEEGNRAASIVSSGIWCAGIEFHNSGEFRPVSGVSSGTGLFLTDGFRTSGAVMTNPEPPKTDSIRRAERRETRALSEEKRAQALELFKHGIGYTKASRILNISVNTVRDWSRDFKRGTFRTEISENQYRYPQEVREHVIRLRLSGHSWSEIRNATGISSVSFL